MLKMISPNIIVNVNNQKRQTRLAFNNIDRKSKSASSIKASKNYIYNMIDYYSNPKKAPITYIDFLNNEVQPENEFVNMAIGYDFKKKKTIFAKKNNLERIKERNFKYLENSNLNQLVISFKNDFINENITIDKLYDEMTKTILPKFFESVGYDPKKVSFQLSFHTDTDNFHFHLAFMEKEAAYISRWKKDFQYRRKLNIDETLLNEFKKSIQLRIEKEKYFDPLVRNIDKEIADIKNVITDKEKNYILSNAKKVRIEEKVLRLGKLLYEERSKTGKSAFIKMKFGSIKNKEIQELTKEIKSDLFSKTSKDQDLVMAFNNSVNDLQEYLSKVSIDNHIDNFNNDAIIQKKENELDSFLLNQIINNSLYDYKQSYYKLSSIKKKNYFIQDLCYQNYKDSKYKSKIDLLNRFKGNIDKEEYFMKSNYYSSEYSFFPNIRNIEFKLNQISRKREFEIKKIKEQQNINWYDRTKY